MDGAPPLAKLLHTEPGHCLSPERGPGGLCNRRLGAADEVLEEPLELTRVLDSNTDCLGVEQDLGMPSLDFRGPGECPKPWQGQQGQDVSCGWCPRGTRGSAPAMGPGHRWGGRFSGSPYRGGDGLRTGQLPVGCQLTGAWGLEPGCLRQPHRGGATQRTVRVFPWGTSSLIYWSRDRGDPEAPL